MASVDAKPVAAESAEKKQVVSEPASVNVKLELSDANVKSLLSVVSKTGRLPKLLLNDDDLYELLNKEMTKSTAARYGAKNVKTALAACKNEELRTVVREIEWLAFEGGDDFDKSEWVALVFVIGNCKISYAWEREFSRFYIHQAGKESWQLSYDNPEAPLKEAIGLTQEVPDEEIYSLFVYPGLLLENDWKH